MSDELILILDYGSQYTQLIARRVRELSVFCRIAPPTLSIDEIRRLAPSGLILSGGPASVYDARAPQADARLFHLGVPTLGICYGMQLMAQQLGGHVTAATEREYGKSVVRIDAADALFNGSPRRFVGWMSHGDSVTKPPPGFRALAHTDSTPIAVMGDPGRKLYGLQFHPEVAHTEGGAVLLKNFLYNVCGCTGQWTMQSFIEASVEQIRSRVGTAKVVLGLSGGVDSSVAALLVHQAIGDQLTCIFIDNGLLRKGEREEVIGTFVGKFHFVVDAVDAGGRFLDRLRGVTDPEQKRKIIGEVFVRVFEEEAKKIRGAALLAQGTLYPDVIESRSVFGGPSATIKTHHNVGGLPQEMQLQLLEPLKELFKDEVRAVGKLLGLPEAILGRHPFPGPGLAVRILGEITEERLRMLQEADRRFIEELRRSGWYDQVWQAFAVLLPVKSVGVMGDERTYEHTIVLRAVTSVDGMTADWARLPAELLERVSNRIINEVKGVNRVVYDISSKPPATIEWE
ncbi:MAG: glutamine-hydrolyzing GMP synthase [Candidatus Omnitrophica bacterium]|nr:glutamine-hydrolyzing GMP synthase [Candidatus Omnitrophota bacterium]